MLWPYEVIFEFLPHETAMLLWFPVFFNIVLW